MCFNKTCICKILVFIVNYNYGRKNKSVEAVENFLQLAQLRPSHLSKSEWRPRRILSRSGPSIMSRSIEPRELTKLLGSTSDRYPSDAYSVEGRQALTFCNVFSESVLKIVYNEAKQIVKMTTLIVIFVS